MPDRVNPDNLVFFVAEHQRRLDVLEDHTEDLGVMRRDIRALSDDFKTLRTEVKSLRTVIITAAVSIAGSSLLAAATIFLVLK